MNIREIFTTIIIHLTDFLRFVGDKLLVICKKAKSLWTKTKQKKIKFNFKKITFQDIWEVYFYDLNDSSRVIGYRFNALALKLGRIKNTTKTGKWKDKKRGLRKKSRSYGKSRITVGEVACDICVPGLRNCSELVYSAKKFESILYRGPERRKSSNESVRDVYVITDGCSFVIGEGDVKYKVVFKKAEVTDK